MVNFDLSCTAHVANFDLCIRALKTHFSPTDGVVKLVGDYYGASRATIIILARRTNPIIVLGRRTNIIALERNLTQHTMLERESV